MERASRNKEEIKRKTKDRCRDSSNIQPMTIILRAMSLNLLLRRTLTTRATRNTRTPRPFTRMGSTIAARPLTKTTRRRIEQVTVITHNPTTTLTSSIMTLPTTPILITNRRTSTTEGPLTMTLLKTTTRTITNLIMLEDSNKRVCHTTPVQTIAHRQPQAKLRRTIRMNFKALITWSNPLKEPRRSRDH